MSRRIPTDLIEVIDTNRRDIVRLKAALSRASAGGASTLDGLSDTTITAIASGELLKWSGTAWINNTLAEAGVSALGHGHVEADISDLGSYALATHDHDADYSALGHGHVEADISDLGDYLPLAGGDLTGQLDINAATLRPLRIYRNTGTAAYVAYFDDDDVTEVGQVGVQADLDFAITALDSAADIILTSGASGVVRVGASRVLTVADEGTGNGLDADTLDGYEAADLAKTWDIHLDADANIDVNGTGAQYCYADVLATVPDPGVNCDVIMDISGWVERNGNNDTGWVQLAYNTNGSGTVFGTSLRGRRFIELTAGGAETVPFHLMHTLENNNPTGSINLTLYTTLSQTSVDIADVQCRIIVVPRS